MSLFSKVLIVVGIVAVLFGGWYIYNQGVKRGIDVTTDIFVAKVDSLNRWYAAHPPSPDTITIYIEKPPLVVHDTMTVVDTIFQGDSLITEKYPYAVWNVSYNDLNGGLIVITYNGEKRVENRIGSFSIQGDDKFGFQSSPWKAPTKPIVNKVPFVFTESRLFVDVVPDYSVIGSSSWIKYIVSVDLKADYAIIIGNRLDLSINGGIVYDKWRANPWYPELGLRIGYRIYGKY